MHNFKKTFGQNFLKTTKFATKLVDSLDLNENDTVIEIGPGDGMVTKLVLETGAKLICIEVDYDLLPNLIRRFGENKNFEIVHMDVLQVNFNELLEKYNATSKVKAVGSLPYNISKKIIENFVNFKINQGKFELEECSFIVQEEVAKEYVALAPSSTFLSNYLRLYTTIRKLESIPANQFFPVPKVNGAILNIKFNKEIPTDHKEILSLIRIGFISPRKTLMNNIKASRKFDIEKVKEAFVKLGIKETARPAELDIGDWIGLYTEIKK